MTVNNYLINLSEIHEKILDSNFNLIKIKVDKVELKWLSMVKGVVIEFFQYTIVEKINNEEIKYTITIPNVTFEGKPMLMLSKLKTDTMIGFSNLIFKVNEKFDIIKKVDIDYRNNLLLILN